MILEYYRPKTLDEALGLLSRTDVDTVPLGGGTVLNQPRTKPINVVDLQSLGLNNIETKGKKIEIGATVTLQQLLDHSELPLAIKQSIRHEATYNIRQVATVAGTIVAADGRSPFGTAILALAST